MSLVTTFMETFNFVERTDLNQIFKILFVICCSDELLNTFYRLYRLFVDSYPMFLLLLGELFIFACFFRIIFYGEPIEDSSGLAFSYSFRTFARTFETLMITTIGGNFPGLILDAYYLNKVYVLLIYSFNFLSAVIIFGIFAGNTGSSFVTQYTITLRRVAKMFPVVQEHIKTELKVKGYDPESYGKIKRQVVRQMETAKESERTQAILAGAYQKFRRALQKIKILKTI